jgi:hypothetical protein
VCVRSPPIGRTGWRAAADVDIDARSAQVVSAPRGSSTWAVCGLVCRPRRHISAAPSSRLASLDLYSTFPRLNTRLAL